MKRAQKSKRDERIKRVYLALRVAGEHITHKKLAACIGVSRHIVTRALKSVNIDDDSSPTEKFNHIKEVMEKREE